MWVLYYRNYYKKHTERLTFDLSEGCTGLKLCTRGLVLVPDTHTEKSDSWPNAFRNYYKKHTWKADLWPFRRLHRSETRHPGSAYSPLIHIQRNQHSWLIAFRNYYKKHTRTADLWPFRRLHRSGTRHPGLALVPDTHTEKLDSWLNAFRNYYKKHTRNSWPLTFTKVAQVWNSAPWDQSMVLWYTYREIRLLAQCI